MNWELLIAAGGLALGVFNVVVWWIERRDRRAEVHTEREARQREIAIERDRLDAELAERERLRRADITPTQLPSKKHREGGKTYRFNLRNMGPSYSKHVTAWLIDNAGRPRSTKAPTQPLNVGEDRVVELDPTGPSWDRAGPLHLMVEWFNDRGERERQQSNVEVNLNAFTRRWFEMRVAPSTSGRTPRHAPEQANRCYGNDAMDLTGQVSDLSQPLMALLAG